MLAAPATDEEILRVDTVPPPDGEDAYEAATRVGVVATEVLAYMRTGEMPSGVTAAPAAVPADVTAPAPRPPMPCSTSRAPQAWVPPPPPWERSAEELRAVRLSSAAIGAALALLVAAVSFALFF